MELIDPDKLLRITRNAIALGRLEIAARTFQTLDNQISGGGHLPTEWQPAATKPRRRKNNGDQ